MPTTDPLVTPEEEAATRKSLAATLDGPPPLPPRPPAQPPAPVPLEAPGGYTEHLGDRVTLSNVPQNSAKLPRSQGAYSGLTFAEQVPAVQMPVMPPVPREAPGGYTLHSDSRASLSNVEQNRPTLPNSQGPYSGSPPAAQMLPVAMPVQQLQPGQLPPNPVMRPAPGQTYDEQVRAQTAYADAMRRANEAARASAAPIVAPRLPPSPPPSPKPAEHGIASLAPRVGAHGTKGT